MRTTRRSFFSGGIVACLLVAAVLMGYLTDLLWNRWDHYRYPIKFAEDVTACAEQYDLDEHIIYGLIKALSNFTSNRVSEDGRIGLMQMSEETFLWLTSEHLQENLNSGLLYEPSSNIRYGCYYLLYLTTKYDSWDAVFAAYLCGVETVDVWYTEWQLNAETSTLQFEIPDAKVRDKVSKIQHTVEKYKELYTEKGDVPS